MALELLQPGFLAQRVAALASVDKLLQQQRLSSSPLLGDLDIPTRKRTRASCNLCFRQFVASVWTHGYAGSNHQHVDQIHAVFVGRTKVRICTVCSAEAKQSHTSAHTTRAGTCPIRVADDEPTTEVEGITHPNLMDLQPKHHRRRSLSMLDRPNDAASFFAQQEEIKRDLELRATELSRRVQLWDEMQIYDCDSSLQPHEQQQEEEKEEPEAETTPQVQQDRNDSKSESDKLDRQRRLDLYPSFMSSEASSNQGLSDTERKDVIRLTAETGSRLSLDYRDSDLSDYEEHTINDLGEICTTTDLSRWRQEQHRASATGEEAKLGLEEALSLVPLPGKAKRGMNVVDEGRSKICQTQQQQPAPMASVKTQEMVDLFNHWKQEFTNEMQHHRHNNNLTQRRQLKEFEEQAQHQEEQARRRQLSNFEEMAQYQDEQARRRQQSLGSPICRPEFQKKCQPAELALQQIQQRQSELEYLHLNRQQPREGDPPVARAQSSVQLSIDAQSSLAVKERYLQQQRQQQLDLAAEKQLHLHCNEALDQSSGEDVELMESSQGEWIPIDEARLGKAKATSGTSLVSLPRQGPGFCSNCGSPKYTGEKGLVTPSCKCSASVATSNKVAGTVLFNGKWISSPMPQAAS
ncbi:unnamed protein product [Peronospora destructor]|uniref:Uncharacterized protein n=1 Tax=Peronospora destructor TaxID=86335 RepID=A0AAV0SZV3_9STRA|nr:unnamed protein product [Peronospora destructor]